MSIERAFKIMGGEPWCFAPDVIGKMTDEQIWELYVKPAVERAIQLQRQMKRRGRDDDGDFESNPALKNRRTRLPTKEEYVNLGMSCFLKKREELEAEYDREIAAARKADRKDRKRRART